MNEFACDMKNSKTSYSNKKINIRTYSEMSDKTVKPFIKWAGGKSALLEDIRKFYPERLNDGNLKYCEPFVGGGAILFDILSRYTLKEVYISDTNKQLVVLYKTVRDNIVALIDYLENMEVEFIQLNMDDRKIFYYEKRDEYNKYILNEIKDEVYGSALFIFLNRTCFNGLYRVNSKGLYNVPMGAYKNPKICDKENLVNASLLLKNVIIHYGDYEDSYSFVDDNTFVYFDPPYRPLNDTSNFTSYSKENFDDAEQIRLARYLKKLSEKGAKIVLSNSDPKNINEEDDFFDNLYSDFNIYRIKSKRRINSKGDGRGEITEIIVSNKEI